jgi:hypothetical protein
MTEYPFIYICSHAGKIGNIRWVNSDTRVHAKPHGGAPSRMPVAYSSSLQRRMQPCTDQASCTAYALAGKWILPVEDLSVGRQVPAPPWPSH